MPNEVLITVKAKNDTKVVFDAIRRDAASMGDEVGSAVTSRVTERIEREARSGSGYARAGDAIGKRISERVTERIQQDARSGSGYVGAGDAIGDTIGRRISERVTERMTVEVDGRLRDGRLTGGSGGRGGAGGSGGSSKISVDVDKPSFLARMASLAKEGAGKFTSIFGTALSGFFSGDVISLLIKAVAAGGLAYSLSGVIGAAISSALLLALGGGVIAAGVAAAMKDPQIKAATDGLKKEFGESFAEFGQSFKPGVLNFLGRLKDDIGPQMSPMIDHLAAVFAPLTDDLGDGLIGFLQNALPAITRAAEAAGPIFETLAESLPQLGADIGYFFDKIAESGPAANVFFNDLLGAIGWIIKRIGDMINFFTFAYVGIRAFWVDVARAAMKAFDMILTAAEKGLSWVPGLGPKLEGARKSFSDFRKKANAELDAIEDETVTVTIKQVFTTVGSAVVDLAGIVGKRKAHGGVSGAASGGARGGLTLVGEHGPELVGLPAGSQVHSNPDSMRMASGGGGGGDTIVVQLVLDGSVVAEASMDPMRRIVRQQFGGSAQRAFT